MAYQRQSGLLRIGRSQQEWPEPEGTPGEILCSASLNWSEGQWRQRHETNEEVLQSCHCPLSPIYTPSKYHIFSHEPCLSKTPLKSVLAELHVSPYQLISRICQNTTRSFLVLSFLWNHNKRWPLRNGRVYQYHPVLSTVFFFLKIYLFI